MKMNNVNLHGRRALVTAGSKGIGAETAVVLAEAGAAVAVNYHNDRAAALQVVERCQAVGGAAFAIQGDASNSKLAAAIVAAAAHELGGSVNFLVANFGPFVFGPLVELAPNEFQKIVNDNLFSTQAFVSAVLPDMMMTRDGVVVGVGLSCVTDCLDAAPNVGPYALSKAALAIYIRTLAAETAAHGVRAALVAPGLIDSGNLPERQKRWMEERVPAGRLGTPREVANVIAFLGSDLSSFCSGATISVAGGWRWDQDRSTKFDRTMEGGT